MVCFCIVSQQDFRRETLFVLLVMKMSKWPFFLFAVLFIVVAVLLVGGAPLIASIRGLESLNIPFLGLQADVEGTSPAVLNSTDNSAIKNPSAVPRNNNSALPVQEVSAKPVNMTCGVIADSLGGLFVEGQNDCVVIILRNSSNSFDRFILRNHILEFSKDGGEYLMYAQFQVPDAKLSKVMGDLGANKWPAQIFTDPLNQRVNMVRFTAKGEIHSLINKTLALG